MRCKDCCYAKASNVFVGKCYQTCAGSGSPIRKVKPNDTCNWMKDKKICPVCQQQNKEVSNDTGI